MDLYAEAIDDLIDMGDGRWPQRYKINRAQRAQRALAFVAKELDALANQAGVTISGRIGKIVHEAERWERMIVRTQLPPGQGFSGLRASWREPDDKAITSIVKRTTGQVESALWSLSHDAQTAMKQELIRGVIIGSNPRVAARRMIERSESIFNGGLARAKNLARTEILDAARESALETRKANRSVLKGWEWMATLDRRTCGACLAQHGSFHPISEPGPLDHQQGRCTAITVTKSWEELGFDVPEPKPTTLPDAETWFNSQPAAVQRSILGPTRLALYQQGKIDFSDLSALRRNANWRKSHGMPSGQALDRLAQTPLRTSREIADSIRDGLADNFGTTVSITPGGKVPTKGYVVADARYGAKIKYDRGAASQPEVDRWVRKVRRQAEKVGGYVGAWEDQGTLYLDVVRILSSKKEALALGRKQKELAIFDLGKLEEIRVV